MKVYHSATYYYTYYYYRNVDYKYSDTVEVTIRGKKFTFKPTLTDPNICLTSGNTANRSDSTLAPVNVTDPFAVKCYQDGTSSTTICLYNRYNRDSESGNVRVNFKYSYVDGYNFRGGCNVDWWDKLKNNNLVSSAVYAFDYTEDPRDHREWTETINTGGGSHSSGGAT